VDSFDSSNINLARAVPSVPKMIRARLILERRVKGMGGVLIAPVSLLRRRDDPDGANYQHMYPPHATLLIIIDSSALLLGTEGTETNR